MLPAVTEPSICRFKSASAASSDAPATLPSETISRSPSSNHHGSARIARPCAARVTAVRGNSDAGNHERRAVEAVRLFDLTRYRGHISRTRPLGRRLTPS